jgi:hypothetical protein
LGKKLTKVIEIVQELLPGVALASGDLGFQFPLELVELELNLLQSATLLIDGGDAL